MNRVEKFLWKIGQTFRIAFQSSKQVTSISNTWEGTTEAQYLNSNFRNNVQEGWRKNELIFACLKAKANTASQLQVKLRNDRTGDEIDDHPLLDLLRKPNPYMDEYDFWTSVVLYQHLGGRAIYEYRKMAVGGMISEMHPLRPDWIVPHSRGSSLIAFYEYRVPSQQSVYLLPENVLDMVLFDPIDLFNGWPPVAVAGRAGDIDNAQTDYIKKYFDEGGVPPGLLKTEQRMNPDKIKEIRDLWLERYSGWRDWQAPMVLGQGYEYQKIGSLIAEMGTEIVDARSEARICSIMQVPPIIVGAKLGLDRSTFSNYAEARQSWWEDTIRPMYQDFLSGLNSQLVPHFGDNIELYFDYSEVPAFQEDETSKFTRAQIGIGGGWMTINEAREHVGLEELDPAVGDVFLRGFSTTEVPMNELRTSVVGNPLSPLLTSGEDEDEDEDEDEELEDEELEDEDEGKQAKSIDEFDQERIRMENELEKGLNTYFIGLSKRLEKAIKDTYGESGNGSA